MVETDITLDNVRLFCERVKEHTGTVVYPVIDENNFPKTMESLE